MKLKNDREKREKKKTREENEIERKERRGSGVLTVDIDTVTLIHRRRINNIKKERCERWIDYCGPADSSRQRDGGAATRATE